MAEIVTAKDGLEKKISSLFFNKNFSKEKKRRQLKKIKIWVRGQKPFLRVGVIKFFLSRGLATLLTYDLGDVSVHLQVTRGHKVRTLPSKIKTSYVTQFLSTLWPTMPSILPRF